MVVAAGATYLWAVLVEAYSALELACSLFLIVLAWSCVCEPLAGRCLFVLAGRVVLFAGCACYLYTYIHELSDTIEVIKTRLLVCFYWFSLLY